MHALFCCAALTFIAASHAQSKSGRVAPSSGTTSTSISSSTSKGLQDWHYKLPSKLRLRASPQAVLKEVVLRECPAAMPARAGGRSIGGKLTSTDVQALQTRLKVVYSCC
jgi:hypothetical protein